MPLTEDEVVESVALHLIVEGWSITSKLTTLQQGIDLVAERCDRPGRLLVEAKGGTSSKQHTGRFGKPFNCGQVKSHVSVAFYYAAMLQQKHPCDRVAIALPDDVQHRSTVGAIRAAIERLGLTVLFVSDCGAVSLCPTDMLLAAR